MLDAIVNWEAVCAIGEVLGAAAVLLTLIYLARQVRNAEKTTRTELRHRYMTDWRNRQRENATNPDQQLIVEKISASLSDDFDEREMVIWRNSIFGTLIQYQANFDLYKDGIFNEDDFNYFVRDSIRGQMRAQKRFPLTWERTRHLLREDFRKYVDSEIEALKREGI